MPIAGTTINIDLDYAPIAKALAVGPALFSAELLKQYRIAGRLAGLKLEALMRKTIQGGVAPPNAQMTADIKGSTVQLVGPGVPRLWKAITSESGGNTISQFEIRVGVKRTNASANVAKIVHDGRTQTVTKKQEVLFRMLWLASIGRKITISSGRGQEILAEAKGVIAPFKQGKVLVIPPRPFGAVTLANPAAKLAVEKEFRLALKRTFDALKK